MTSPDQLDASASTAQIAPPAPKRRRICSIPLSNLQGLPPLQYVVKTVFYKNTVAVVYGAPGSGKTFLVFDMILSAAREKEWFGKRVKTSKVLYICGEGGAGIQNRWNAYALHNSLNIDGSSGDGKEIPFSVINTAVNLRSSEQDLNELIEDVKERGGADIIVIDTLNRALGGGSENDDKDMGAFFNNCSRIREETGACVIVVHHCGKSPDAGARGHSLLLGNIDTEIKVTRNKEDDCRVALVTKQRDSQDGEEFHFFLKVIELGTDEDGEPITSCVVVETDTPAKKKDSDLTFPQNRALTVLAELIQQQGDTVIPKKGMPEIQAVRLEAFRAELKQANLSKSNKPDSIDQASRRAIRDLESKGKICTWGEFVWLA